MKSVIRCEKNGKGGFQMTARYFILSALLIFTALRLAMPAAAVEKPEVRSTGAEDQTGIAITIYNVNLGLVKDQRSIKLAKGTGELRFMDVASQIIPTSVHIKSLSDADGLQVLEQNYEYDLLNPQKLLDKYVGKEVKLFTKNPYSEREESVTATLLSNNGGPIFRIGDEITFGHPGRRQFAQGTPLRTSALRQGPHRLEYDVCSIQNPFPSTGPAAS